MMRRFDFTYARAKIERELHMVPHQVLLRYRPVGLMDATLPGYDSRYAFLVFLVPSEGDRSVPVHATMDYAEAICAAEQARVDFNIAGPVIDSIACRSEDDEPSWSW